MPSTYTTNNGIEKIGDGEQSGAWGDTTNTNFDLIDQSLDGLGSVLLAGTGTTGSPNTISVNDGATSTGRNRHIFVGDSGDLGGTAYLRLDPNDAEKIIIFGNGLSGGRDLVVFQGTYNASNVATIPTGRNLIVRFDGGGTGARALATRVISDIGPSSNVDINGGEIDGTTIGASNPDAGTFTDLSVTTSADFNGLALGDVERIEFNNTGTAGDYIQWVTAQGLYGYENGNEVWRLSNGGGSYVSGTFGINTDSPSELLHVFQDVAATNAIIRVETDAPGGSGSGIWELIARGTDGEFAINDPSGAGADLILQGPNGSEPGLTLLGGLWAGGDIWLENAAAIRFENSGGTPQRILTMNSGGQTVIGAGGAPTRMVVEAGGGSELMRLNANDRVGVGTVNPDYKMQVNGTFGAGRSLDQHISMTGSAAGNNLTGVSDPANPKAFYVEADADSNQLVLQTLTTQPVVIAVNSSTKLQANTSDIDMNVPVDMNNNQIFGVSNISFSANAGTSGDYIQWVTAEGLRGYENGVEQWRLSSGDDSHVGGSFGIGLSNPAAQLHVQESSVNRLVTFEVTGGNIIDMTMVDAGGSARLRSNQGNFEVWTGGDAGDVGATNSDRALRISTGQIMEIDSGFGSVAPIYGCRAWATFVVSGGVTVNGDGGVSSITLSGTVIRVNFSQTMPDTDYAVNIQCENGPKLGAVSAKTTTYVEFEGFTLASAKNSTGTWSVTVHR